MIPHGLAEAAEALAAARTVFAVSGAGTSAESGIPTFRGPGGLWEGFRAEELATPEAYRRDPDRVWRWYRWRAEQYGGCLPNPGHHVLAAMDAHFEDFLLATQNVDGLHRRAGSTRLVELHGTISHQRCTRCSALEAFPEGPGEPGDAVPSCQSCGAPTRPHILWFGEIYWPGLLERAGRTAARADVALVVGTSAQVWPPAALALHAQQLGALLVEVNPHETTLSDVADVRLRGPSGQVLPALWRAVQELHPA